MAENNERGLVPKEEGEGSLVQRLLGFHRAFETSLDLEQPRGRLLYGKAMGEPEFAGRKAVGREFTFTDFLVHTYTAEDSDTGELSVRPRVCMFTTDNQMFAFSGRICCESFANLVTIWGMPPWPDGKRVKVVDAGRGYKMVPLWEEGELIEGETVKKPKK